ncbi:hypothetical protein BS50DRAFT_664951 [Corynespora cassiicola Philippines]|uniref:Uncharacterized protein n=1 Tax=Corynespora cassiicola Philippines TaxID=1448308 RepID=A0A2T2NQU5_CORCC|nr:hypothetical protein BS50DRAFT_664951 [Corynespora cassiicola Philippines]
MSGETPSSVLKFRADFKDGWNKLPNEMKSEILQYVLKVDKLIGKEEWYSVNDKVQRPLFRLLSTTPDIASLSKQVYYQKNMFVLRPSKESVNLFETRALPVFFAYPNPRINQHIRLLRISINALDWEWLVKFATGNYGFLNLQQLCVIVGGHSEFWTAITNKLASSPKLEFNVPGHAIMEMVLWRNKQVTELVKSKVSFSPEKLNCCLCKDWPPEFEPS